MTLTEERPKPKVVDSIEVLIPEARQRSRRRRLRAWSLVFVALILGLSAWVGSGGLNSSTSRVSGGRPAHRVIPALAIGTVLKASSVVGLKMFTPSSGLAISTTWNASHQIATQSYLTATKNAGDSWKIVGRLPIPMETPLIAFVSPTEGYVADYQRANSSFLTLNGGRTWTKAAVKGLPTALSVSGNSVWVVAGDCPLKYQQGPWCATYVDLLGPGDLKPTAIRPITVNDPQLKKDIPSAPSTLAARFLARTGPQAALVVEGQDGPNSILSTTDAGRSWRLVNNPCGTVFVGAAAAVTGSRWYLFCSLDGGMQQGTNLLYETWNGGTSWTLLAQGHEQGANTGSLTDGVMDNFATNSTGSVLWYANGVGFINVSTDGGRNWVLKRGAVASQWSPVGFVSVGSSAFEALEGGGLIRTTNGRTWAVVRSK